MRTCLICNQRVAEQFHFCGYCGAPLPAPGHTPPRSAAFGGERREVTVLFLDVTNFTAASRTLDSERVFTWMDDTMRLLASVVDRYEGTLDKFTGDGLMALFGVPEAHENNSERAVLAALAMQDTVRAMRAQVDRDYGIDFQVRIGINTGAVVAGSLGGERHGVYTVLGDTVNLASRLEKTAEPGTILVSASTYAGTAPLFDYEPMPPLLVKGVSEPLETYRPLRAAARPGSLRGLKELIAPMVGREQTLRELYALLSAVTAAASPVVMISGEAGLGKSRLTSELRRAIGGGVRWVQGSCQAHTRFTPLWLIASLLHDLLGLPAGGEPHEQRGRLTTAIRQLGLPVEDLEPYLAYAIGLSSPDDTAGLASLDAAMLQRQLHTAIRQVVLATANLAPLLLCCDDLHWLDTASRDALAFLLVTTDGARVGFILVGRDAGLSGLPASTSRPPQLLAAVALEALPSEGARALVARLLGWAEEHHGLTSQIATRAAGNPLYIEEILRTLIEQGGLAYGERGWELTDRASGLLGRVPHTLRGMILARFDRLEPGLRALLHGAAVIGRACAPSLLAEVAHIETSLAERQLGDLAARGFLREHGTEADPTYTFPFDLLRDGVYETLLERDRRHLHRRAATAIEADGSWPPEDQNEAVAYHYAESDTPQRAIELLVTAGAAAERRYAAESAIRHYRHSLALMQDYPSGRALLGVKARLGLARALKVSGAFDAAAAQLDEVLDRLQVLTADRAVWRQLYISALGELADVHFREGALDRAAHHLEQSLRMLGVPDDQTSRRTWQGLMHQLASVRLRQGQLQHAHELAAAATVPAGAEDDPVVLANLYGIQGGVCYEQGMLDEAAVFVERSLDYYTQVGYLPGMANAYANLGALYYAQGKWAWSVERLERANQLRRAIGYVPEQALTLANLALVHMAMGDHERAAAELHESMERSRRSGDNYGLLRAEIGLSHLAVIRGSYPEAARYLTSAADHLDTGGDDELIQVRWLQALVAAQRGDLAQGRAFVEEALSYAQSTGSSEQRAECLRVVGVLLTQAGELAQAVEELDAAVELAVQRGDPYQEALALIARGEACLAGTPAFAPELAGRARSDFSTAAVRCAALGATWDQARAEAALVRLEDRLSVPS